jgi:hypothetical protein
MPVSAVNALARDDELVLVPVPSRLFGSATEIHELQWNCDPEGILQGQFAEQLFHLDGYKQCRIFQSEEYKYGFSQAGDHECGE